MRTTFAAILLMFASCAYALHVECVGNAVQLDQSGDTLLLFASSPEVKTLASVGNTDWYRLPDTIHAVQTGTDYLYPEHGYGYGIKVYNQWEYFYVFDYDSLRANVTFIQVEADCINTILNLEGTVPQMTYTTVDGSQCTYKRPARVSYKDGQWDSENAQWVDSAITVETNLGQKITVPSSALETDFCISDPLASKLSLQQDSICSKAVEPIALKAHPVSITTTRGDKSVTSNEVNRPYTKDDIINVSAPLDVLFVANGLNADYYEWNLYRGSEPLVTRMESAHRYTFTDPGNYRAVVHVSNPYCELDSVEFSLSVSESMLLVPNVFTPNGDGANDEFRVAYRSLKEFHCWVYNRWGTLVYEWSDPAKGWDGTIGGKPAAEGAYFYVIRAMGTDADKDAQYLWKPSHQDKVKKDAESRLGIYQLSGSINLLRGGK